MTPWERLPSLAAHLRACYRATRLLTPTFLSATAGLQSRCLKPRRPCTCCSKDTLLGLPGGTVGGNLPASAGDRGLIPGRKILHAAEQAGSVHHDYWSLQLQPLKPSPMAREATAPRPQAPAREQPLLAMTRGSPHSSEDSGTAEKQTNNKRHFS